MYDLFIHKWFRPFNPTLCIKHSPNWRSSSSSSAPPDKSSSMTQIHCCVSEISQYCHYGIHSNRHLCLNRRSFPFIIKLLADINRWNQRFSYQKSMDIELIIMHQFHVLLMLVALLLEWIWYCKCLDNHTCFNKHPPPLVLVKKYGSAVGLQWWRLD